MNSAIEDVIINNVNKDVKKQSVNVLKETKSKISKKDNN